MVDLSELNGTIFLIPQYVENYKLRSSSGGGYGGFINTKRKSFLFRIIQGNKIVYSF